MKVCSKCGIEKDESEFGKSKLRKDGLGVWCKLCMKKYRDDNKSKLKIKKQEYNSNNKKIISDKRKIKRILNIDKQKEADRERYKKNRNFILARQKESYILNKDEYNLKRRIERQNNPEKFREYEKNRKRDLEKKKQYQLEYYDKNKKYLLSQSREYQKTNVKELTKKSNERRKNRKEKDKAFKIKLNMRSNFNIQLRKNKIAKSKSFNCYTGIAYADYIKYFENNYPLEFAEITIKGKYHIDHIIPCAVYDFNNPDHIMKCWQPGNLRIIPAAENLSKNDKLDFDLIRKHKIEHLLPEGIKKPVSV